MKTAVNYLKYSSDSQTEHSIEGQMLVYHDYANSHGILILDIYIDKAMTGTNDNRPDFQRMIKDSSRKEWDYVLVYKLDRFSRNKHNKVKSKTSKNKYGKRSIEVVYLLLHRLTCDYCGQLISAECGTARGGEKKRY